jgi:hypothetical protein
VNCHREPCPGLRKSLSPVAPISVNVAGWPYDVRSNKKVTGAADGNQTHDLAWILSAHLSITMRRTSNASSPES